MESHTRPHFKATSPLVAALAIASLLSGCSPASAPPTPPARADAGGGAEGGAASKGEPKARKLRPGQQDPGSANYSDKPGERGRGR